MEILFGEGQIEFSGYDIPFASVYPAGQVQVSEIRDADWLCFPPEIRTLSAETLFVPKTYQAELVDFCTQQGITQVKRLDVWGNLLEPFLDTEFSPTAKAATMTRLVEQGGLSATEVDDIRDRVAHLMIAYNFDSMLWEWAYLGLYDVLHAAFGRLVADDVQRTVGPGAEFYRWVMRIADQPKLRSL